MNAKQRVMTALDFQEPDRVPRFWQDFWPDFQEKWRCGRGPTNLYTHFGEDVRLVRPDEAAWPSRAATLGQRGDKWLVRSGWGEVKLSRSKVPASQVMGELIEAAVPERIDPEKLIFEDPCSDRRFHEACLEAAAWKDEHFVFCKSGGPYLRAAFMRGEQQFWIDVVEDPDWTRAFVDRVVDHIIAVAIEAMRRFGLEETGIAIYDDVAANWGPFVGPAHYEQVFLPSLRRMVNAFKAAGAARVMHHADGNVLSLLDMWIDAGIDAINPVEFRSGMDAVKLREKYGRQLAMVGGLDNCIILPRGDRVEIRDHVLYLLEAGRGGGYVFGPHSIGPDISLETMDYVLELLQEHGNYPL